MSVQVGCACLVLSEVPKTERVASLDVELLGIPLRSRNRVLFRRHLLCNRVKLTIDSLQTLLGLIDLCGGLGAGDVRLIVPTGAKREHRRHLSATKGEVLIHFKDVAFIVDSQIVHHGLFLAVSRVRCKFLVIGREF